MVFEVSLFFGLLHVTRSRLPTAENRGNPFRISPEAPRAAVAVRQVRLCGTESNCQPLASRTDQILLRKDPTFD